MWDHDKDTSLGKLVWEEVIVPEIENRDSVFYICSPASLESYGQFLERNYAVNLRTRLLPVRIDGSTMPTLLAPFTYAEWDRPEFSGKCKELAERLHKDRRLAEDTEGEAGTPKPTTAELHRVTRELTQRREGLDPQRIQQCEGEFWRAYYGMTLPRKNISRIGEKGLDAEGIVTIANRVMVDLEKFTEESSSWRGYFSDLGRSLAIGEKQYLLAVMREQVKPEALAVSRTKPNFEALQQLIKSKAKNSEPPDTLLAPTELLVPFYEYFGRHMDWAGADEMVSEVDPKIRTGG